MKNNSNMSERTEVWLKQAPMPDFINWLKSLYNDNILAVSNGGMNPNAAFAEYGKKLLVDRIIAEHSALKNHDKQQYEVVSGSELLQTLTTRN